MQIDLTAALSVMSTIASLGFGAWLATARYALNQREREIEAKIGENKERTLMLSGRLHEEEKAIIQLKGELDRTRDRNAMLDSDIEEIKRTMVTKNEWEPRMTNMERTLNQVLSELRGISTRYSSHQSTQNLPAVRGPKKDL